MNLSWHHSAIAALIALAPLTAAAAPAEVGTPAIAWQSVGTLSPATGYAENIGVAGLVQSTACCASTSCKRKASAELWGACRPSDRAPVLMRRKTT